MTGIILIMQRHFILQCVTVQHYALTYKCSAVPHEKEMSLLKVKPKDTALNKSTATMVSFSLSQKICLLACNEVASYEIY
jgi:hypothetical protein